jgi:hypothetical protein
VFDRTISIEIIVEGFNSYRLIGTESTAFMTLSPFVSDLAIIYDSGLQISKESRRNLESVSLPRPGGDTRTK